MSYFASGPAEMFGKYGESYSRIGYEDGYLPMARARYEHDGIRYKRRWWRPIGRERPPGKTRVT